MDEVKVFFGALPQTPEVPLPKDKQKLYRERMLKENPHWDAERTKRYRTEHPEKWNYMQAKFFWKRLTIEQRKCLTNESV